MDSDRIADYQLDQGGDNASNANVTYVETGKHVVVLAFCAAICGICVAVAAWCVMEFKELSAKYEKSQNDTGTEYRVVLNHYMKLEAEHEVFRKQLEVKNERR